MIENPLLPHRQLRELHELMLRCRRLSRRPGIHAGLPREALLAATAIHLRPGDLLCGEPGDGAVGALAPGDKDVKQETITAKHAELLHCFRTASHLGLAAAMAYGLQAAGNSGVVAVYAGAHSQPSEWPEALSWASERQLPLIVVCSDALRQRKHRVVRSKEVARSCPPLNWIEINRQTKRSRLPLFSVDGEDAVAVYRVMQEAVLRARSGVGPAVLWAVLGSEAEEKPVQPVARLRRYMAARNIPLTG